jgi:pimeloyl-ACP methyl ester carboxylesterase
MKRALRLAGSIILGGSMSLALAPGLSSCSSSSDSTPAVDAGVDAGDAGDGGLFTASTRTAYPTDGGTIHMPCQGTGALPVVFLAGGDDIAAIWTDLITALGPRVLTCTYDRPNVLPSYHAGEPLTPQVVADALAEALAQANLGARFLLVGHSLGGISVRVFGASYADRVAGALFLDPTVPAFMTANEATKAALVSDGWDPVAIQSQGDAVTSWSSQARVTVLSHDPALAVDAGTFTAAEEALWDQGQQVYAHLTPHGTQTSVPGATHYVYVSNQDVVVAAILDLLGASK